MGNDNIFDDLLIYSSGENALSASLVFLLKSLAGADDKSKDVACNLLYCLCGLRFGKAEIKDIKYRLQTNLIIKRRKTITKRGVVDIGITTRHKRVFIEVKNYAAALGRSDININGLTNYLKYIKGNPSFYLKGTASVVNGQINMDIQKAKIGNLTIPESQIQNNESSIISFVQTEINSFPGFSVQQFSCTSDGKIKFTGTLPAHVALSPSK